jgi:hypothetical protein
MTNKQKVKNAFPSAYSFKRDGLRGRGTYEIWVDGLEVWIKNFFDGQGKQLYPLANGKTWQEAWNNAWVEVQKRMIKKLES